MAVIVVVVFGVLLVAYRATWHNWPWEGDPARMSLCGRDYDRAPGPLVRRAALGTAPLHFEFRVPWLVGREVVSRRSAAEVRHPPRGGEACAGDLFLRVAPDRYRDYELSGGP